MKWEGNIAVGVREMHAKMIDDPHYKEPSDWLEFFYLWMAMFFFGLTVRLIGALL